MNAKQRKLIENWQRIAAETNSTLTIESTSPIVRLSVTNPYGETWTVNVDKKGIAYDPADRGEQ